VGTPEREGLRDIRPGNAGSGVRSVRSNDLHGPSAGYCQGKVHLFADQMDLPSEAGREALRRSPHFQALRASLERDASDRPVSVPSRPPADASIEVQSVRSR